MATLSAPDREQRGDVIDVRMPPPTVSGMKQSSARSSISSKSGVAALQGRGDVEEHELVDVAQVVDLDRLHRAADTRARSRSRRP